MKKKNATAAGLALGALGVVFGDIGTNPLYVFQAIFGHAGRQLTVSRLTVYGIISLIFWSVLLVVAVKYIGLLMRADNKGEGGIMALVALLGPSTVSTRYKILLTSLGLVGIALFYGDSTITPAISVLSAVEGLRVSAPSLSSAIIPITLVILAGLFWVQKYGTGFIGKLFGPVMLLWFLAIGIAGADQVVRHPSILASLSPLAAVHFYSEQPLVAFVAMGAVVLAITGAEALYADMGHFGRKPIGRAWFGVVFPALTLCYMGEGAWLLEGQANTDSIFFRLFPGALHMPMVVLATVATLIASQSVIAGAFSLTRQAMQLNFLPKMRLRYTSAWSAGQIYVPFVNFLLFVAVALLVVFFGSSEHLANAYGIAVSGTLAIDTVLFLVIMRVILLRPRWIVAASTLLFVSLDLLFVASNSIKLVHGGWVPVLIAAAVLVIMLTWRQGQQIVAEKRLRMEGSLESFIDEIRSGRTPIVRVPGQVVYIGHHPGFTPLALRSSVEELHELPEKVVIVFVEISNHHAHISGDERAAFDDLGYDDGISALRLKYGFHDVPDIPRDLAQARHLSSELDFNPKSASYFISQSKVVPAKRYTFAPWRKALYMLLARNALSRSDYFNLPVNKTVEVQTLVEI